MTWLYVPLLGAVIGFLIGAVPLYHAHGRRMRARGHAEGTRARDENELVDVTVECACGAEMNLSDASEVAVEPLLNVWWQWHINHRITIDEYRVRVAALSGHPPIDDGGLTVRRSEPDWADDLPTSTPT